MLTKKEKRNKIRKVMEKESFMSRFFLPDSFCYDDSMNLPEEISLTGEDAFHLSVSQRARIGDEVTLCAKGGYLFSCKIKSISGGKKDPIVILEPFDVFRDESEPNTFITLYQGMPKGKKTDTIIQKCTELGVSRIVFVYSDHAVPELSDEEKKISRFEKIALEACKQSQRGALVSVSVLDSLDKAIEEMKENDTYFACFERESHGGIKPILKKEAEKIAFFVGPEGGISPREELLLREAEIPTVTLGKRILRTETAGSAVLSMILYEKEL